MYHLFLASSVSYTTISIASHFLSDPEGMKLVFIPTASEVEQGDLWWLRQDREALVKVGFDVYDFSVTGKKEAEVCEALAPAQAIFISGGNTYFLLQELRKSGADKVITKMVKAGTPYIGSSAGSCVAGRYIDIDDFDDKSLAPELKDYTGLGLTDVVIFPHLGNEHFKDSFVKAWPKIAESKEKMIILNDYQYLWVEGEKYTIENA